MADEDIRSTKATSVLARAANCTEDYYKCIMESVMPEGALVADTTKHAPHGSYSPPLWYVDVDVTCIDCKTSFVFTKEEQRTWFEEYRIPIHVRCNRCAPCRKRVREAKETAKAEQKRHTEEVASRPPHPNEAFFKKKTR